MQRIHVFFCFFLLTATAAFAAPKKSLDIYSIDVEGGQATLIVNPAGQSLLVDTGFPEFGGRDADRIAAAVKMAGLKQIDYVLFTHYHKYHVGGSAPLAELVKIGTFIDHVPEKADDPDIAHADYATYAATVPKAKHMVGKPVDQRSILNGLNIKVISAAGQH